MPASLPVLPTDGETIAELRELYRAAEARAARLRLLSVSGHDLAGADPANLDAVLASCAERLAFFLGCRSAQIVEASNPQALAIPAPGGEGAALAGLEIQGLETKGLAGLQAIPDAEDREAVTMHLELMGTTIARIRAQKERGALLDALKDRERALETLLERIFTAQEEERRRVSHELHDGVAQTATALVRLLENAKALEQQATGVDPVEVARGLVSELRRVIAGLRPTLLDDLGLVAALQSLAEGLEADGYAVSQSLIGPPHRLAPLVETALFRVAQEAVNNIRKHAGGPCPVRIEADFSLDQPFLRISDSGKGLPPAPAPMNRHAGPRQGANIGIEVMRERVSAIGAQFDWRAGEAGGVVVEVRLGGQG